MAARTASRYSYKDCGNLRGSLVKSNRILWTWCAGAVVAASAFALAPSARAQVTDAMIADDANSTDDVLTVGMGQSGQRFSPLKLVNAGNVADLVPVWTFSFGGEKQRGQETQPLVYNGKIFVTGSYSPHLGARRQDRRAALGL